MNEIYWRVGIIPSGRCVPVGSCSDGVISRSSDNGIPISTEVLLLMVAPVDIFSVIVLDQRWPFDQDGQVNPERERQERQHSPHKLTNRHLCHSVAKVGETLPTGLGISRQKSDLRTSRWTRGACFRSALLLKSTAFVPVCRSTLANLHYHVVLSVWNELRRWLSKKEGR